MEQLQALRELAKKVEAGALDGNFTFNRFNYEDENFNAGRAYHNGSLDAAHSLHKAVLGDRWILNYLTERKEQWAVSIWSRFLEKDWESEETVSTTPARAWLLAIIKAKIAELENA